MFIWVIAALGLVVGIKYYTSLQMRRLERRLGTVKDSLLKVKKMYTEAQATQKGASEEEGYQEERIKFMKEIIQDIQMRLTSSDKPEETEFVGGSPFE